MVCNKTFEGGKFAIFILLSVNVLPLKNFLLCNYIKIIFTNMALLKYFKIDKHHSGPLLPDLCGPLNQQLRVTVIEEANKEVTEVLCDTSKCQTY